MDDIFAEISFILQDMIDHRTEENDVGSSAERNPDVGHRGGARVAWIDVNDLGVVLLASLDHPLKTYGVILGHRRTHDEDGV